MTDVIAAEHERLIKESRKRYYTDAEFHAVVDAAVGVLNVQHHTNMGTSLSRSEQMWVRQGAALALLILENHTSLRATT